MPAIRSRFEIADVRLDGLTGARPAIRYRDAGGAEQMLECDFVAGCDGFHGVTRGMIPPELLTVYERVYPFAWLGILSNSPPVCEELIYSNHERGFALFSQRSPSVQRMYLQCAPDEDLDEWPDERIWAELQRRLEGDAAPQLDTGEITQKGVTPMRSFVVERMQYGRLFLAGDAAHIVPPTGAKGMNLAVADVAVLSRALAAWYAGRGMSELDAYSATCLSRVWKAERFSWWMTSMLHRNDQDDAFGRRAPARRARLRCHLPRRVAEPSRELRRVDVSRPRRGIGSDIGAYALWRGSADIRAVYGPIKVGPRDPASFIRADTSKKSTSFEP